MDGISGDASVIQKAIAKCVPHCSLSFRFVDAIGKTSMLHQFSCSKIDNNLAACTCKGQADLF
jgi:hypothetical protein